MALGSAGGLFSALLAGRIPRTIGLGRTLLGSALVAGVAELVIAMTRGPLPIAALLVIMGGASVQLSASIYSINSLSLRQAIVPDRLQGRVNATARIIAEGGLPLGALLGDIIADHYGLRLSVLVAGCGTLFAFFVVLLSPVRSLQEQPSTLEEIVERKSLLAPLHPHPRPILHRLRHMIGRDHLAAGQIRNRPCQLEDPVIRPCR